MEENWYLMDEWLLKPNKGFQGSEDGSVSYNPDDGSSVSGVCEGAHL